MSSAIRVNKKLQLACAALLSLAGAQYAAAADWKPIIDARVRYEGVDQTGIAEEAEAVTARLRLGIETPKFFEMTALVEGEFVSPLVDDYFDTIPPSNGYPVVADPESYELNRAQIAITAVPKTTITIGRQRINLDDQRFVGAVGWRQNEQTLDAVRVVNSGVPNVTFDVTYFNRVNRIFSHRSPQGVYEGDSFLGNVGFKTPVGRLTAFTYLLDIENIPAVAAAVRDSNSTYGIRFAGDRTLGKVKLAYAASYAQQEDYADNPLSFDLDYYFGELNLTAGQFGAVAGIEILDGNGAKGFATPLATLHKFQGWADKFLGTPANGLDDIYAGVSWTIKGMGPFDTFSATAVYHDFKSERLAFSAGGDEIDLQIMAKWKRLTTILKYADYSADGLFTDTKKLWVEFGYVW